MQETPEFPNLQTRFNEFSLDNILNSHPTISDANHRLVLEKAFETLALYFNENEYRSTLTTQRKRNIEGQVSNILAQFDQIRDQKNNDTIQANIESVTNNIQSYLDELDLRFSTPFKTYLLEDRKDTSTIITSLQSAQNEAERARKNIQDTLSKANLLVGGGSENKIANYFQRLSTGQTVEDYDKSLARPKPATSIIAKACGIVGLLFFLTLFFGADELSQLLNTNVSPAILILRIVAVTILMLSPIVFLIIFWLNKNRPGGYKRAAIMWALGAVMAVVGTGIYASVLLLELDNDPGWEQIVPKLVALLAPAYLVRLCVRNYRANEHLATLNAHRATVARVIDTYVKPMERSQESLLAVSLDQQSAIYLKAAELIFDPGETGFLSRSEGAGATDNYFDGFPTTKH